MRLVLVFATCPSLVHDALRSLRSAVLRCDDSDFCTRIERKVRGDTDVLGWLQGVEARPLVFFAHSGHELGGAGAADIARADDPRASPVFQRRLPPGACYVGGGRFDEGCADEWSELGGSTFVLPEVTVETRDGVTTVGCNVVDKHSTVRTIDALLAQPAPTKLSSLGLSRIVPDSATWRRNVRRVLDSNVDKVVLARREEHDACVDPVQLLQQFPRAGYRFGLVLGDCGFVGCSPELLFRANATTVSCDVVAGTRPRGDGPLDDRRLASDLLSSEKDRVENDYVADSVRDTLARFGTPRLSDLHVLRLPTVQHLRRTVHVDARVDVQDCLKALHPTPATLGSPPDGALDFVRETASFDYGWYAGPFGVVAPDETTFCVAIRSALVTNRQVFAYAGAGIVNGSDPDAEADEVRFKLKPVKEALNSLLQCNVRILAPTLGVHADLSSDS